ncbi:MAG: glycosyltransferase family 2 protein [Methylohalobius sp.]
MTLPLVSVVLPTHNRRELLAEAIASLEQQSYSGPIEILIADDASSPPVTPSSLPACRLPIRIVRHSTPKGGAAAKNLGIRAARGEYLVFLDDDDLLAPGYVEDALTSLRLHPEIKTLFMNVEWFGEHAAWGQTHQDRNVARILAQTECVQLTADLTFFRSGLFSALLDRIPMPFQRPVLRRQDFERIGFYQEDCLLWDCEWALRASLYGPCALLKQSPYRQRASGQGYSSQTKRQEEHILSMLTAKQRLFTILKENPVAQRRLQDALAEGWFNAAYFYAQNQSDRQALAAILKSQRYRWRVKQLKLLLKILVKRVIRQYAPDR